jgi:hypothetical protein
MVGTDNGLESFWIVFTFSFYRGILEHVGIRESGVRMSEAVN